jgi:transcriptional regulator with XRE-family HTH domain
MLNQKENRNDEFSSFEEFFEQAEAHPDYWEELAKLEFTREVTAAMDRQGVSRTELARRLQVRPGMVTRLLTGNNNFELATMVRLAFALGYRFRSHLHPLEHNCVWVEVLKDEWKSCNENWARVAPLHCNDVTLWEPEKFRTVETRSESSCAA